MVVRRAIKGKLSEQPVVAPELESMLIYFAYARKLKPDEGPALHSATTAKDTISAIEESVPAIGSVYAALCDYAHPARGSLCKRTEDFRDVSSSMIQTASNRITLRPIVATGPRWPH